jgi:hypothetical protein
MKNRLTVRHGMLSDLKTYLTQSGWNLEDPVGKYEVLRARNRIQHRRARYEDLQRMEAKPPQARTLS